MAAADFRHDEMDIAEHEQNWQGFKTFVLWGSLITLLSVGYAVFTLALGMNWMVALILLAGSGIVGGLLLGMGSGWVTTVIGLSALAVFIQICITLARIFI